MSLQHVGVVGAGVMGIGVAQNLAQTGHRVTLVDNSFPALQNAQVELRKQLRFGRLFAGRDGAGPASNQEEIMERITFTLDSALLEKVDFVVENVTEKWEAKEELYPELDQLCAADVVFAVNTSCISVTRVGALTGRPERVVGVHFMNPVPLKTTVEVIRGFHTSSKTLDTTSELLASMGKTGIVVNDSPGFVSNRVLMLTINEAIFLVQEDVAPVQKIDQLFKSCFGHKMGPLETADLIGLDTILYSIEVLHESYRDSKYRPCPLLQKMVDAGLHGRKSGQGFYNYRPQ